MFIAIFSLLAQTGKELGRIGGEGPGLGPFGNIGLNIAEASKDLTDVLSKIIGIMTMAGGLWFMIQFVVGAFKWLTSGGDKNNVESAKEHLTHAVIGLAVLVAAYVIVGLIGAIFGLDILNPQTIINSLIPSGGSGGSVGTKQIIRPPGAGPQP